MFLAGADDALQAGERLGAFLRPVLPELDLSGWKTVALVLDRPDGSRTEATLCRSPEWIAENNVVVAGTLHLDLPEMNTVGRALVLSIQDSELDEPTHLIAPKPLGIRARRITGLFRHERARVYDLRCVGEPEPIGATAHHPFWSVDRSRWVSVEDLRIAEHLKTIHGTTTIQSITKCPEPEPVYNIEVEGDHAYRVGDRGVLVHNQSAPAVATSPAACCPPPVTGPSPATLGINLGSGPDADVNPATVSNQPQAHHIVAGSAPGAAGSRMIVFDPLVCIGINDAINGVWLPQTSGVTVPASTNPLGRVFHNHTFSPLYHAYVFGRLNPVRGNRMAVESALRMLRQELIAGTVSW